MFGEHESESPRVPSPWDHFLPNESSVNSAKQISRSVPKLVPEAEEGNVEYKLKLTNISPARFARLVTQLKWRLLEGGGQAYYELGVADSGALIGLSRADLEQSLETLEMMAGEIGASVIVVKEIEVPPAMYTLADDAARLLDPVTGGWTCKMKRRMVSPGAGGSGEEDATTTATETETDFTDGDFDDTPSVGTPADDPHVSQHNVRCQPFAHRVTSHPGRLSTQSSPFISPLDDDLALFSMEPEPPHILTSTAADDAPALVPAFSVDLEIASVYKPRPMRRRTHALPAATPAAVLHGKHARRQKYKEKEKKTQPWHTPPEGEGNVTAALGKLDSKAAQRRLARDRRREDKRRAYQAAQGGSTDAPSVENAAKPVMGADSCIGSIVDEDQLACGLEALHVEAAVASVPSTFSSIDGETTAEGGKPPNIQLGAGPGASRLIVEALVVRKMSIEEAFLDFGGFQLV